MTVVVDSAADVAAVVRELPPGARVLPVAGATKPALSSTARADARLLDVSRLRGIVEYDPAELTLTAQAATPVAELARALDEHDQYLPFDPPLADAGATLGGVVATGASGANAFRHGGVRDFVIGVRLVDGCGRLVAGGGKVVKNAAGFDLPKLMVGSIGRLGVVVQLSVKVFPRPRATTTLEFALGATAPAMAAATRLARGPLDLEALDVAPDGVLLARLGGHPDTLDVRAARLEREVGAVARRHEAGEEAALWRDAAELTWVPDGSALVRVALTVRRVAELEAAIAATPAAAVRYGLAGAVAWIAWPAQAPLDALDAALQRLGLPGMVLRGALLDRPLLGATRGGAFAARVAGALDPHDRFLEV